MPGDELAAADLGDQIPALDDRLPVIGLPSPVELAGVPRVNCGRSEGERDLLHAKPKGSDDQRVGVEERNRPFCGVRNVPSGRAACADSRPKEHHRDNRKPAVISHDIEPIRE
jgi:hypothetical protein